MTDTLRSTVARINGVALHAAGRSLSPDELRQRACTELLRQAAQRAGLLAADDAPSADGVISEAAASAIEALLEQALERARTVGRSLPPPPCRARRRLPHRRTRARAPHPVRGDAGRGCARPCASAPSPSCSTCAATTARPPTRFRRCGAQVVQLPERRSRAASWAGSAATDCAPEFARELFGHAEVGVLPRLVHSRFGLHVVEVLEREPGVAQSFESVRGAVAMSLRQQAYVTALRQYLRLLAGAGRGGRRGARRGRHAAGAVAA